MNKFIKLLNYNEIESIVELENVEDIETMCLLKLSGDEVLMIKYKNGLVSKIDSNANDEDTRYTDILDEFKFVTIDDLRGVE